MAAAKKGSAAAKVGAQKKAKVNSETQSPKAIVASKKAKEQVEEEHEDDDVLPDAPAPAEDDEDDEDEDDSEDEDDEDNGVDLSRLEDLSDSDSDSDDGGNDDDEDAEEEEEEIDIDDLSPENSEDEEEIAASTRVRQTINNKEGLLASLKRFALDTSSKVPFATHQSIVSAEVTEEAIPSVDDDLQRELAFMNQSLEAARLARTLLKKEGVPFTRPTDYFAETVRSDETMEKVKAKMIEEATAKKASAEARKLRDLKKFGKQVQVAKQQERAKQKRDTLDKIKDLKRKRQQGQSNVGEKEADDLFDVAVDNELSGGKKGGGYAAAGKKRAFGDKGAGPNPKRQKKDSKYGFGGKKKYSKSGDAISSGDISGFSVKKNRSSFGGSHGGAKGPGRPAKKTKTTPRLGKSKRQAAAGKR